MTWEVRRSVYYGSRHEAFFDTEVEARNYAKVMLVLALERGVLEQGVGRITVSDNVVCYDPYKYSLDHPCGKTDEDVV